MIKVINGKEYPAMVIPLINDAKKSIDIVVFDWRWYPQDIGAVCQLFNQSILRASKRGVKVRAIANNDQIINILKNEGCLAKRLLTTKLVHCKLMIIDDEMVITGSHNYSQSAFQMNLELSVIISNTESLGDFLSFFNSLWGV